VDSEARTGRHGRLSVICRSQNLRPSNRASSPTACRTSCINRVEYSARVPSEKDDGQHQKTMARHHLSTPTQADSSPSDMPRPLYRSWPQRRERCSLTIPGESIYSATQGRHGKQRASFTEKISQGPRSIIHVETTRSVDHHHVLHILFQRQGCRLD